MTDLHRDMKIQVVTKYTAAPAATAAPPVADNGYWTGTDRCGDSSPNGYICTARAGHAGDHMGWWATGERHDDGTWPQTVPGEISNDYEPVPSRRCRESKPTGGYVCWARKGHSGDHIGWYGPGEHTMNAVWPQR